jgi:hypothetical protein
MRGARISLASAIGAAAIALGPAHAATPATDIDAVVREKLAAVSIVRTKARKYAMALANGRLLQAYLSASTASEGDRLKARIISSLQSLQNRYGLTGFRIVWRDGDLLAEVGQDAAATAGKAERNRQVLQRALTQDEGDVSTIMSGDTLTYVTAVERNGQKELVLCIEQSIDAYERVLMLGLARTLHIVIVDEKGKVVTDSAGNFAPGTPARIAGLTPDELRARMGITGNEGTGVIAQDGRNLRVSFQSADGWTAYAIEQADETRACLRDQDTPCP